MFKNSGKKIMGFVNFVFYLNLVVVLLAVAGAAVYVYTLDSGIEMVVLAILGGLVAAALYMLLLFFGLLGLYAFGELVQSNIEIKQTLMDMQLSAPRFAPQAYRESPRVSVRREEKPTIAERVAPPVEEKPMEETHVEERPVLPVEEYAPQTPPVTETVTAPARPSFAYDYKAAAGAPVFPVNNPTSRTVLCPKCGAKHDPGTPKCRYCSTPLN